MARADSKSIANNSWWHKAGIIYTRSRIHTIMAVHALTHNNSIRFILWCKNELLRISTWSFGPLFSLSNGLRGWRSVDGLSLSFLFFFFVFIFSVSSGVANLHDIGSLLIAARCYEEDLKGYMHHPFPELLWVHQIPLRIELMRNQLNSVRDHPHQLPFLLPVR